MITIGSKTAIVYQGGGRWCVNKRTAYRRAARAAIKAKCDCSREDHGPMGIEYLPCRYHHTPRDANPFGPAPNTLAARIVPRLARWLQWRDARAAKGGGAA